MKITAILAHVDHGKTTLIDSLLCHAGQITTASAGTLRFLDTRKDEQQRGITLKLSAVTLNNRIFIDTPGHVDFEHLVGRAVLASDTSILIIDVVEGITPRTFALCNYLGSRIVVVVNKIDKIEDESVCYARVKDVLDGVSAMIDSNVDWSSNNVILACSTMCMGINCDKLKQLIGCDTLLSAVKFVYKLRGCVETGKVDKIVEKYKIKRINDKNIYTNVLSLAECVYSSLNSIEVEELIYENKEALEIKTKETINTTESFKNNLTALNKKKAEIVTVDLDKLNTCLTGKKSGIEKDKIVLGTKEHPIAAVNTFSVLKTNNGDELHHAIKTISGTIKKGMKLFSKTSIATKEFIVDGIFMVDGVEVEFVNEATLIFIKGDILANSYVYDEFDEEVYLFFVAEIESKIKKFKPFYLKKVKLLNSDENLFKSTLKMFSFVEGSLSVKRDKYGFYDIMCQGKVQFEKIESDLKERGFDLLESKISHKFVESAVLESVGEIKNDCFYFWACVDKLEIINDFEKNTDYKSGNKNELDGFLESKEPGNFIQIKNIKREVKSSELLKAEVNKINENEEVIIDGDNEQFVLKNEILSVLNYLIAHGPLTDNKIFFTKFMIKFWGHTTINSFNTIKQKFIEIYLNSKPTIHPFYYSVVLYVTQDYLCRVYTVFKRHKCIFVGECFNERLFYEVEVKVPQVNYLEFINELKIISKGTVYVKVEEYGYLKSEVLFDEYIDIIREERGIKVKGKIVDDPEKQRTLKK